MDINTNRLRLVFMGTPLFAVPSLEAVIENANVVGVVTQPDRTSGRRRQLNPPPVKLCAVEEGIEVYQPDSISHPDTIDKIRDVSPELIVVVAYGAILDRSLLELPALGCINIHPSLLPCYRGPCPVEWAIMKGETVTGVSCIYMDEKMDTGDIIAQRRLEIAPFDTAGSLNEKLAGLGAKILEEVLSDFGKGKVKRTPQRGKVSYAPFIKKEDCCVNWERPPLEIHNFVRALNPNIGARACLPDGGNKLIIWETASLPQAEDVSTAMPGEVLRVLEDAIVVAAGGGAILVKTVQPEGGVRQTAAEYIRGHHLEKFGGSVI